MDQTENNLDAIETKELNHNSTEHITGGNAEMYIVASKNCSANLPNKKECSVVGCEESKNLESELYYRFPEDPKTREVWTSLTGRSDWTPKDDSYVCVTHFSVDSFTCNQDNDMILLSSAIPSLRLPSHVLETEYIEDSESDSEGSCDTAVNSVSQMNGHVPQISSRSTEENIELIKLFSRVQRMQRQAVGIKDRLKYSKRLYARQKKYLQRLKEIIASKESLLKHKRKKMLNIDIPMLEKIREERNDMILSTPAKYTDDLKNFALSVYKYSPQSYVYIRNTLRTMLPSSNVLEGWINAGYQPRNLMSNSNLIKVVSELTESELSCKICLH